MKRATLLTVLLASGVALSGVTASAQTNEASPSNATSSAQVPIIQPRVPTGERPPFADFFTGGLIFGLQNASTVGSSKFEEYRDFPSGGTLPALRAFGSRSNVQYDFRAENVRQADERYTGFFQAGLLRVSGDYNAILHNLGNSGRTMLLEQSPGVWTMLPTAQAAIQTAWENTPTAARLYTPFLTTLLGTSINEGNLVDVSVQRHRSLFAADIAQRQPFSGSVSYSREQRHGSGGLSANYLSYVTETPSVTEYLTEDVGGNVALNQAWGSVRGALHYNSFKDQVPSLLFDSPFRATDAVAATIGSGIAATSVGGPAMGRTINPPDNEAYTGTVGTTIKLPAHTRITGDVNLARLTQNAQLFPFVTNTALLTPQGMPAYTTASLPVQSLNGKINTTALVFALSSRPADALQLNLRYRRYDLNNQTPRIGFVNGVGNMDRTWSSTARITVPYGHTTDRVDATAGYTVGGMVTFEGGYHYSAIDRTYRETLQTAENTGSLAVVLHAGEVANLRATYEKARRKYDAAGLDLARSEDASLINPPTGLSSNVLGRDGNLRFDQSNRDSDRVGFDFDISAGETTTFLVSYLHHKDAYTDTAHGLLDDKYDTITGEVAFAPGERLSVFANYTYEKNGNTQLNNGSSGFPTLEDFQILLADKTDSVGAGAMIHIVPKKIALNVTGRYQKVNGNADFITNPNSSYQKARAALGGVQNIPNVDDTKLVSLDGSVDYTFASSWTVTLGALYEDYTYADIATTGLLNLYGGTSPAGAGSGATALFLAPNNGSYSGTVAYVRLGYRW